MVSEFGKSGGRLSDEQSLQLYGLFKQKNVGNVNIDRPGIFSQKERSKWDAWNSQKDKPQAQAAAEYVDLARQILPPEFASRIN